MNNNLLTSYKHNLEDINHVVNFNFCFTESTIFITYYIFLLTIYVYIVHTYNLEDILIEIKKKNDNDNRFF